MDSDSWRVDASMAHRGCRQGETFHPGGIGLDAYPLGAIALPVMTKHPPGARISIVRSGRDRVCSVDVHYKRSADGRSDSVE